MSWLAVPAKCSVQESDTEARAIRKLNNDRPSEPHGLTIALPLKTLESAYVKLSKTRKLATEHDGEPTHVGRHENRRIDVDGHVCVLPFAHKVVQNSRNFITFRFCAPSVSHCAPIVVRLSHASTSTKLPDWRTSGND